MMNSTRLLFLLSIFALIGCGSSKQNGLPYVLFDSTVWKDGIKGHGPLSNVANMQFSNDKLYLSDTPNSELITVSPNLDFLDRLGGHGLGPGELNEAGWFFLEDDQLVIGNNNDSRLNLFLDGVFESRFNNFNAHQRFFSHEGFIYFSDSRKENPIQVIGLDGTPIASFGKAFPSEDYNVRRGRSNFHLNKAIIDGEVFCVAVSETEPLIQIYDLDGLLLLEKRLDDHPRLQARMDTCEQERLNAPKDRAFSCLLFDDAVVWEEKLYILVTEFEPYSNVLVFQLSTQAITEQPTIRMPFDLTKVAVGGPELLFAFDRNHGILHRMEPSHD